MPTNTYAPRLPLSLDSEYGYEMLKSIKEVAKQNFKCLVLTSPGERMMDPLFGVGIKKYLFENITPAVRLEMDYSIKQQVATYMPFIQIREILIESGDDFTPPDYNKLFISINYTINSRGISDSLKINLKNNQ